MARRYRFWSQEQKLEIIKPVMECEITITQQAIKYEISEENIIRWIKNFKEKGIEGLENKRKPGNPLAKIYNKKNFKTREEELEYENMKLKIENELLKKGYLMKGDGTIVKFTK